MFSKRNYLIIIVLLAVLLGVGGGFFYLRSFNTVFEKSIRLVPAHFYKNPARSLANVRIKTFYAVPRNKRDLIKDSWKELLEKAFADVVSFHGLQFHGLSKLSYDIFPKPIILEEDSLFYDSLNTSAGNPHALVSVSEEIERRVFRLGGDLYDVDFSRRDNSAYPVMGIIYEGVGSSGGVIYESKFKTVSEIAKEFGIAEPLVHIIDITSSDGFFLVNRNCLNPSACDEPGPTLVYHELAHTFGIPDEYEGDISSSDDIMGLGRMKPIDSTYLDAGVLKDLGVIQ